MSALTGVGPAIASGSQTYSGNCADLPNAPSIRKNGTAYSASTRQCTCDAGRPGMRSWKPAAQPCECVTTLVTLCRKPGASAGPK